MVAGIIGAAESSTGGSGFSGVAPDATIIAIRQSSLKFAPAGQSAPGFGDVDTLAMAVRTAADMGATVINVSSIACVDDVAALDDRALGAALRYAVDVKNVVVVAAAGNVGGLAQCPEQNPAADPSHPGRPDWDSVNVVVSPAWYDDYVLTVGSVDPRGAPSRFTLAGPWVDVAAPGEDVISLDADGEGLIDTLPFLGDPMPIMGTSYAAPVVSGIAALVRARSPYLTARQVMQRIKDTAHRPPAGWDPFVGHGVVDARAAVSGDTSSEPMTVEPGAPHDDKSTRFRLRQRISRRIRRRAGSPWRSRALCRDVGGRGGDDGIDRPATAAKGHCRARLAHCPCAARVLAADATAQARAPGWDRPALQAASRCRHHVHRRALHCP